MAEKKSNLKSSYCLRHAAGRYWLLDLTQPGLPYKRPVCMNDAGAVIWEIISSDGTKEQAADALAAEYGITQKQAEADVEEFVEQLRRQGVML